MKIYAPTFELFLKLLGLSEFILLPKSAQAVEEKDWLNATEVVWGRMFGPQKSWEQSQKLFRLGTGSDTLCLLSVAA